MGVEELEVVSDGCRGKIGHNVCIFGSCIGTGPPKMGCLNHQPGLPRAVIQGSECTHAKELVRWAFFATFHQVISLDNSNGHVAELKCFKHLKIEFESTTQNHPKWRLMVLI